MKKRQILKSILPLFLVMTTNYVFATTWYVRPNGGSYGSENGTSYANAWDGFNNIVWGTGGVQAGDTLYICGTHYEKMLVGASGTSGSLITIRGDYDNDAGVIDGSEDIKGKSWTETSSGSNKWHYANGYSNYVLINDKFCKRVDNLNDMDTAGEWYYSNPDIYIYSSGDPSNNSTYSNIRVGHYSREYGIKVDTKDYITIQAVTLKRIETRLSLYGETDGAILIKDSQYCNVNENYISQCGRGIMVAGESDYCIVEDNFVEKSFAHLSRSYWYARPIYSVANYVTIRRNTIDGLITFYDDTTLRAGTGIDLQIQNYPDYYCYNAQVYRNEVRHVAWYGVRCQQFITGCGIQDINLHVYENYIHDSKQSNGTGEEDGIAFGCNAGDASNHFTGVYAYGNVIVNCANTGVIVCNNWDEAYIYNNLIVGCAFDGGAGIYISTPVKDCIIQNNTLYDTFGDGIVCYGAAAGGSGIDISNNIISKVTYTQAGHGKAVFVSASAASYVSGSNNCFYDIGGSPSTLNFTNTNGVTSDPSFVSATGYNFRLNTGSPCINAGTSVGLTVDIDGNSISGNPDIGCYEGAYAEPACYLRLDETTGTTADDESSNGNDGILSATLGSSNWVSGKFDNAIQFNANWGESINCGNDSSIVGQDNYTVMAWLKVDSASSGISNRNIAQLYTGSTPEGFLFRLWSDDYISFLQCSDGTVWNGNLAVGIPYPHDDEFHHVAATFSYDGTTCVAKLYLDGALRATGTDICTPDIATSSSSLQLGTGVFDGIIDEFRFFDRVLTEKQIWDIAIWDLAN